jgi:adenylate cyclase
MKKKIQLFWQQSQGLLLNTISMGTIVICGVYLSIFQLSELGIYDLFLRILPQENKDEQIVIVTIDESDLNYLKQWPVDDEKLTKVLQTIIQQKPLGIGMDIYRDLPVPPGYENFINFLDQNFNIIGVEKFNKNKLYIRAPKVLEQKEQVGLAEIPLDSDGKVRRALLSLETKEGKIKLGLGTKLALMYLEKKGITEYEEQGVSKLGKAIIKQIGTNSGGYVGADTGGYQVLINYRGVKDKFETVSFKDVLDGEISEDVFKDKIVFIGSIATSLKDLFTTPYNIKGEQTPGVIIHANIASQLISAALDNRPMINVLPESLEWLWILLWAGTGATVSWMILEKTLYGSHVIVVVGSIFVGIIISIGGLLLISYFSLVNGWWIPTAAPLTALLISALSSAGSKAHQLYKLAILDGLTQISNRRYFDEQIHRWWWRLMLANKPLSILLCDVDFFKPYNDTYGHQDGDKCLQAVAKAMRQNVRGTDMVARYGGEEFVVILPGSTTENALKVAERIRIAIKDLKMPHRGSKVDEFVSISGGLASVIPDQESSPMDLIAKADQALYQAKQQGRDRVVISDVAQV